MTTEDTIAFIRGHFKFLATADMFEEVRRTHAGYIQGLIVMAGIVGIISAANESELLAELMRAVDKQLDTTPNLQSNTPTP